MVYKLHLKIVLIFILVSSASAQNLSREVRNLLLKTVVQIAPWDDEAEDLVPWTGSGTIISPKGHILTNYHVVGDLESRQNFKWHAILMSRPNAVDQPPEATYWARYIDGDPTYDLAILQIKEYANEEPIPNDLTFPALPIGDSNNLFLGDMITVIGYPSISGSTITFTRGIMSGWVGEDFQSGGKQWIKTDAKISRGSSGGTAVNDQGELIGIPTLGLHEFQDQFYEEQLFIRPISLAWTVIGPNVPEVQLASRPPSELVAIEGSSQPQTPKGSPTGNYGSIALNSEVSNSITARTNDAISYHTYVLTVPRNLPKLTITVKAGGHDIDLAVKLGGEITSYSNDDGDFDFKDFTKEQNPKYIVDFPKAGKYYIDVVNLVNAPTDYILKAISSGGVAQNPLNPSSNKPSVQNPPKNLPTLIATSVSSGTIGRIAIGQKAKGELAGLGNKEVSYHTYILDVPVGTKQITVYLSANEDLDLAAKYREAITNYGDQIDGGDWNYRDISSEPETDLLILNPKAGQWYIDVYNALKDEVVGAYTLNIIAH